MRTPACALAAEQLIEIGQGQHLSALTGYTSRIFEAVAHLCDAWEVADGQNASAVAEALAVVLRWMSPLSRAACVALLRARLDREHRSKLGADVLCFDGALGAALIFERSDFCEARDE